MNLTEFIFSVAGGCFGCFCCLAIINDIAMDILLYFMCCFLYVSKRKKSYIFRLKRIDYRVIVCLFFICQFLFITGQRSERTGSGRNEQFDL